MGHRRRRVLPIAFVVTVAAVVAGPSTPASAAPPSTTTTTPTPTTPATPSAKPASKPSSPSSAAKSGHGSAASTAKNGSSSSSSAKSAGRTQDTNVRRQVAGGPTLDDTSAGADTPELRALHAAERELFPPASPSLGSQWPQELPFPVATSEDRPRVHASGLSPVPPLSAPPSNDGVKDMAWLSKLDMPDLPIRWDARVVKYLEFFKDDPRGRSTLTTWLRRSGRYRESIRKVFRKKGLPEDLTWLAMIESGFEPIARSPVGAMGLWQFMPDTGKIYGLSQDRWVDQRMSFPASTEAAADFLADLYRRFGSWDLAMAGYNMGYGGVLSAVRRYNTNDYWALAKLEGSFPWETTLYVPKILAAAIVARNLAAFGYQDVTVDPPLEGEDVPVGPGIALAIVATACGVTTKEVEQLNPELRASRTPPSGAVGASAGQDDWAVKVPNGKAGGCTQNLAKAKREQPMMERYVVRFGETLEQIAQARKVSVAKLVELNAITPGEVVRGGTILLVPKTTEAALTTVSDRQPDPRKAGDKPVVVVPQDVFVYPDRKRVFYRVQVGDTVRDVCATFKVTPDELRRWNDIDPSARLVEGMTMQVFAPSDADLSRAVVLGESDVRTIVAGTDDFFHHWDEKGRRRLVVTAKPGDTLESIGKQHGVTTNLMERINRRGRSEPLVAGDRVVVWVPGAGQATSPNAQATLTRPGSSAIPEPMPTPPLGAAPSPEMLPPLP
ncbi:MAG: Membrane-bound lytic murein transglycosylase precursor [Myxococcaceae bacterium]|nr:Membrane-bound lytic murein transglycosylase precursor [Myxococcaceae bacterium]